MTKIKLVEASVVELKPGHKYIIAVDLNMVTHEDAANLASYLDEIGIPDVVVALFRGNPKDGLKVIEESSGGAVKSA
jgi:hypothetical protein